MHRNDHPDQSHTKKGEFKSILLKYCHNWRKHAQAPGNCKNNSTTIYCTVFFSLAALSSGNVLKKILPIPTGFVPTFPREDSPESLPHGQEPWLWWLMLKGFDFFSIFYSMKSQNHGQLEATSYDQLGNLSGLGISTKSCHCKSISDLLCRSFRRGRVWHADGVRLQDPFHHVGMLCLWLQIQRLTAQKAKKGNQFWYILPSTSTDQIPNATVKCVSTRISHLPAVATISAVSPDLYRWPWLFVQLNSNRASPLLTDPKLWLNILGPRIFAFAAALRCGLSPTFGPGHEGTGQQRTNQKLDRGSAQIRLNLSLVSLGD